MDLCTANKIFEEVEILENLFKNKIGVLSLSKSFSETERNKLHISIQCKDLEKNKVGNFLFDKIYNYSMESKLYHNAFEMLKYASIPPLKSFKGMIFIVDFDNYLSVEEVKAKIKTVINHIIKALYFAVDEAKVEFGFYVVEASEHDIPDEIFWELDTWNEGWIEDGEPEKCVPDDNMKVYKFKKDWLYSICLGYYAIDLDLFETDVVPELIGILFDSTEDFCYITSYEDENWVYLYSVVELNEDNVFDIEEGLFNVLGLIATAADDTDDTLEDMFSDITDKEN
jgi:hypothetical protein